MAHLPLKFGRIPVELRDKNTISKAKKRELLLDYKRYELYYCNATTGEITHIAKELYDHIIKLKTANTVVKVIDADKMNPPKTGVNDIAIPVNDREYNRFYYIVKNRIDDYVEQP